MAPLVRLDVWSDYVCPFCYLEEPVLTRIIDEFGNDVKVNWQAFELRPEPVPRSIPMANICIECGMLQSTQWLQSGA
jgi:predicted DsbA family dithiol-disulfide isomerase